MKKLMIAAAVVLAAVASQAAMVDWNQNTRNGILWQDGSSAAGKTAYLLQFSSETAADTYYASLKSGDVKIADAISSAVGDSTIKSGTSAGKIADTADNKAIGEGVEKYYAILCTTKVEGKDWFLMSDVASGIGYDPNGQIETEGTAANFDATFFDLENQNVRTGWTEAVPEPTSGLLLLLGVAGLALKRKRA